MMVKAFREHAKSPRGWLAGVIALYCLLALFTPSDFTHLSDDFAATKKYAESIINEYSLSEPWHVAPGQPVFIALSMATGPVSNISVRIGQIMLLVVLIVTTYMTARILFGERVAIISSTVLALWPAVVLQIFSQSADLLYLSLFTVSVYFLAKSWKTGSYTCSVLAGLFAAVAALTDPIGLYLPVIYVLVTLALGIRAYGWSWSANKRVVVSLALLLLAFVALLLPWYARNVSVFGRENAPLIQKSWETELFKNSTIRSYVLNAFSIENLPLMLQEFGGFFIIPYSIDSLDRNTETSYKLFLVGLFNGESDPRDLAVREWLILIVKCLFALLHWALVAFAVYGAWLMRRERISVLYIAVITYLLIATFSYGLLDQFENISPLNGFFFNIVSVTIMLGVFGFLSAKNKLSASR